jgi:hypothetical protein
MADTQSQDAIALLKEFKARGVPTPELTTMGEVSV